MPKIKNQKSMVRLRSPLRLSEVEVSKIKILNFGLPFCILTPLEILFRRWKFVFLTGLIFAFWITCFAEDKIVAIVNQDVITQKDLNDFINFMRMQLSTQYQGRGLESKIQSMQLDLIDKLIEDRLILQEAKKNNVQVDENQIKARITEIKSRYPSNREFQLALSQQGLVEADIESKLREQLLMRTIIEMKVNRKIIVKPGEVTDFYEQNREKFKTPLQREFTYITLGNKEMADSVFKQLGRGLVSLEDLAKKYNLAIDKLRVARSGQLMKDVEEELFKLRLNDISLPLEIQGSFYILRLDSIISPQPQNLTEAQDDVYRFLFEQKFQEELDKWLSEVKQHSYIKIFTN